MGITVDGYNRSCASDSGRISIYRVPAPLGVLREQVRHARQSGRRRVERAEHDRHEDAHHRLVAHVAVFDRAHAAEEIDARVLAPLGNEREELADQRREPLLRSAIRRAQPRVSGDRHHAVPKIRERPVDARDLRGIAKSGEDFVRDAREERSNLRLERDLAALHPRRDRFGEVAVGDLEVPLDRLERERRLHELARDLVIVEVDREERPGVCGVRVEPLEHERVPAEPGGPRAIVVAEDLVNLVRVPDPERLLPRERRAVHLAVFFAQLRRVSHAVTKGAEQDRERGEDAFRSRNGFRQRRHLRSRVGRARRLNVREQRGVDLHLVHGPLRSCHLYHIVREVSGRAGLRGARQKRPRRAGAAPEACPERARRRR